MVLHLRLSPKTISLALTWPLNGWDRPESVSTLFSENTALSRVPCPKPQHMFRVMGNIYIVYAIPISSHNTASRSSVVSAPFAFGELPIGLLSVAKKFMPNVSLAA